MEKSKDIGLVVATKREALFMKVRDNLIQRIEAYSEEMEVAEAQLKQAKEIIKEEKNAH